MTAPYTGETTILIVQNALHIKLMHHNLFPPFIMRAAGKTVNDVPKIQVSDPTVNDHCIIFPDSDLRIPLNLKRTFSFFHTRTPTVKELYDCDKAFITPDANDWNPNCTSFALNEQSMLNFQGEMNLPQDRSNLEMELFPDEEPTWIDLSSVQVHDWNNHVDECIDTSYSLPLLSEDVSSMSEDNLSCHFY